MTTESTAKDRATLYRKIAAVTAAVSRIPKNGENTFHRYKYATESDITDGLRDLLKENGLAFLPPSVVAWERDEVAENPKLGPRTRVQVQFAIGCCDTGEVFTSMLWGEGQDTSDKGFYKAYTGAVKYFLMKTFLIATGDDPEHQDQQAQQRQAAPQRQSSRPAPNGASYTPPPVRPAPAANGNRQGAVAPRDAADAERRFFGRYSEMVGGGDWAAVQRYLESRAPKPTTFEGWVAAADAVRDRARQVLLTYIGELTQEAEQLDLDITLTKPLDDMTGAELNQHCANLEQAIEQTQRPGRTPSEPLPTATAA